MRFQLSALTIALSLVLSQAYSNTWYLIINAKKPKTLTVSDCPKNNPMLVSDILELKGSESSNCQTNPSIEVLLEKQINASCQEGQVNNFIFYTWRGTIVLVSGETDFKDCIDQYLNIKSSFKQDFKIITNDDSNQVVLQPINTNEN